MAKNTNQKLKSHYILKILKEYSSESRPIPMTELLERLHGYGISCERKSVYSDIEELTNFGYDIIYNNARQNGGYYLGSRDFELAELKILVDAVSSSRFITTAKSQDLIRKLEDQVSSRDAGTLKRQVVVSNRIKNENESIYYIVDDLHRAIHENVQIRFQYMEWDLNKKLVPRRDGHIYQVSPWSLFWNDENYYLIAYDDEKEGIRHYRVDKIKNIEFTDLKRNGRLQYTSFDPADYAEKTFGMFGGRTEGLTISLPNHLVGVILDRFGRMVTLHKESTERFSVHINVNVSPQFYGWLSGLGKEVRILSPDYVKEEYVNYLKGIIDSQDK
ncbi:MAG: WYL domain-containing protein [Lachnospiraceae bacterium]|nr:WYL domain-containing protein [Lachnospiraceae bacterium]